MGLTKAQLDALNDSSFPNNNGGLITPLVLRDYNDATIVNTVNQDVYTADSASFNTRILASTGSVTSAITASSLITASFDNGTRNLTFTKGNATQFSVNIPDVSGSTINTGSFATTGSNTFTGIQNFTADITSSANVLINGDLTVNPTTSTKLNGNTDISAFLYVNGGLTLNTPAEITWVGTSGSINSGFSASVATTGSNTFIGNQLVTNGALQVANYNETSPQFYGPVVFQGVGTASVAYDHFVNAGNFDALHIETNLNAGTIFQDYGGGLNTWLSIPTNTGNNPAPIMQRGLKVTGSLDVLNTFTASLQEGYVWAGGSNNRTTLVATSSFGGGTTYINPTLNPYSGSLILVANTFTSSSFAHISASANGQVNLVFKNNNNTADTILSGSNNLFVNPAAPGTGFKRYIGGSGNIALNASNVPIRSGSMAFSPTMNNNYFGGNGVSLIMRGPVSSSAWTISGNSFLGTVSIGSSAANNAQGIVSGLTMSSNQSNATINIIANKTNLSQSLSVINNMVGGQTLTLNAASSSFDFQQNIGSIIALNSVAYSSLAVATGGNSLYIATNQFAGFGNHISASGVYDTNDIQGLSFQRAVEANIIGGINNRIDLSLAPTGSNSLSATALVGLSLIITGSSKQWGIDGVGAKAGGSAFFGRYNAQDGNRAQSGQTVFAIGTGNSTTRKTGFLIDSGSNAFFEGTLNVSGSTTMTGSLSIAPTFEVKFATGSNQQAGTAVLDGGNPGAVTVSNSLVTANSIILLTKQTLTNAHMVAVSAKSGGSFTITSNGNGDTDTVGWFVINNS